MAHLQMGAIPLGFGVGAQRLLGSLKGALRLCLSTHNIRRYPKTNPDVRDGST